MREINKIIIHCSASTWGTAEIIDQWHKQRGWDGIGYHYVIQNGYETAGADYNSKSDGIIKVGRPIEKIGAHCHGHNQDSIGICLIGNELFSGKQFMGLGNLLRDLKKKAQKNHWQLSGIFRHCDFDKNKTCPNLPAELIENIEMWI